MKIQVEYKGIKWHKRQILKRRLKARMRKNCKELLEILGITAGAFIFLAEFWVLSIELIILF